MRRPWTTIRMAALAAALLVAGTMRAQSATTQATATVVTPLVVTGIAPLAFGVVYQGVSKTIANNAASSGRLRVTGFGTSQIRLTVTLPAVLTNGASTMPINQYSVRINGVNNIAGGQVFSLVSGNSLVGPLTAGNVYLWVGARVQPSASQAFGSYAGSLVLTAVYTGL
ncbi:MAG: hypothetical protein IT355_04935 [Gemmatimonadaceae bacterium]|nr:hypothetical protein [Gemmatimonadaceae bacterium]